MALLALSLGSNIDAPNNIRKAVRALRHEFDALKCSSVYESEAIGFVGANFLNLVAIIETTADLSSISSVLKLLEDRFGRNREQPRFSARTLDVDILFYGDEKTKSDEIELPKEEITQYAFVLQPLAELLPDRIHGFTGLTYADLWDEFDQSNQQLWKVDFDWRDTLS
ncbi:MAG: 2-amino-4-hydroxy-6-hydroxymethyldihydropteridine diphosphokinase [Pseudomonadota bacterium]|nr:2-amino-4-hydroxy-6-hydroxymethyldihydropteridine diphosphokinase [Pseudomonadota bacterium]MED5385097.1 2-amino-4-hydroxy-6-hydroxymethyldihydropteridine diphosphokinase [Pseudomonadota bacterium]MED6332530.1 2-amino-4-hydroxy-6-hydroxymethyldihydropteridine diphosphokinase [Pseudomonadota bacterium]MEE3299637.1 2-amino-4-hydroxy-6-hydroxymethyldihydropteridine diphosphokinase [Pseudomonadota bacterium]